MATFTRLLYHIVFSTKYRQPTLCESFQDALYRYISGIIHHKNSSCFRINGTEDHIHIATHIHQTLAIADLVRDIKVSSNHWIKENNLFPHFRCWQENYAAFTVSFSRRQSLFRYIDRQKMHHAKTSYRSELIRLLQLHQIPFDEAFLD